MQWARDGKVWAGLSEQSSERGDSESHEGPKKGSLGAEVLRPLSTRNTRHVQRPQ